MASRDPSCAHCGTNSCRAEPGAKRVPASCPVTGNEALLEAIKEEYLENAELRDFAAHAARTEAAGYCRQTRVEEIIAFARRLGVKHVGIACCVGTKNEAKLAQEIFEAHGLRVSTVACKVGSIPKEEIGLRDDEKIRPGQFEPLCNPAAQAKLLAAAGAELNVIVGLCVGHDSIFFQYAEKPTTVLMVKDRVTGHNPAAALYTSGSYYRRLKPET